MPPFLIAILLLGSASPELAASIPPPQIPVEAPVDENTRACNCYLEVKSIIPDLPLTKDLKPNSPARPGAVAIYLYSGNLPHYAYVESVVNDGVYGHWEHGSHLHGCGLYERFVLESNPYLVGYWYDPALLQNPTTATLAATSM